MKAVLESIQPVIARARFVSVNEDAIGEFVDSLTEDEFHQKEFDARQGLDTSSEEQLVGFTLVYNAISFCYWGDPKWTVTIDGKEYDGAQAMTTALLKAIRDKSMLLDPHYLAEMPENDLATILQGNVVIPLFQERLGLLRVLGQTTVGQFGGSWVAIVDAGKRDAVEIVDTLVTYFPDVFKDEANYRGHTVRFYKRAQIVPETFAHDFPVVGITSLLPARMDHLTAFADYKVPQILRKLGILVYTDDLANKVDNLIELPEGREEEIEVRAHTIDAIEKMTRITRQRFEHATAAKIDGIVWFRGQRKSPDDKPYHRTRTIWY